MSHWIYKVVHFIAKLLWFFYGLYGRCPLNVTLAYVNKIETDFKMSMS